MHKLLEGIKEIKHRLWIFFHVDLPCYWHERSLLGKICIGIVIAVLVQLLIIGVGIGIFLLTSAANNSVSYPTMHPIDEVVSVSIVHIDKELYLYDFSSEEAQDLIDQHSTVVMQLNKEKITTCMKDLSTLSAKKIGNDPPPLFLAGGTLLITYQDGSQEWLCAKGTFCYNSTSGEQGMSLYYFNAEEFINFLTAYGYMQPNP